MKEYPAQIEMTRIALFDVSDNLRLLTDKLGEVEDVITANVATAEGDNGKPLYSNAEKRKAAIAQELLLNEPYQQALAESKELRRRQELLSAKLERLRGEFSVAKILSMPDPA